MKKRCLLINGYSVTITRETITHWSVQILIGSTFFDFRIPGQVVACAKVIVLAHIHKVSVGMAVLGNIWQ